MKGVTKITEFFKLPDSMSCEELQREFVKFLDYYSNNTNSENMDYVLDELFELSDRQWHTYELLNDGLKMQIEEFLKGIIDFENEEAMDSILCIIPRLGLKELFDYILQEKDTIKNESVIKNIMESEIEYGKTVDNPYSGMS